MFLSSNERLWVTDGGYSFKVFGSGTRLVVSERTPKFGSLTIYHNPEKKELLCVAKDMFPDVLKMTWLKNDQVMEKVPHTIQEMKDTFSSLMLSETSGMEELKKYACQVQHEAMATPRTIKVESQGGNENSGPATSDKEECLPKAGNATFNGTDLSNDKRELLTMSLSYTMLILKSLTYFGIMSIIIYKRASQMS